MINSLIISKKEIQKIKKNSKKKIVLCHGAFDLIHPGHIDHLEKAKKLGDILVVTLTADKFLKKHLHSPIYKENERLNFLKKIKIIDYVFIINSETAIPVLEILKPNFYCKGKEYLTSDQIGNLNIEKKAARRNNCKIVYLGSNIKSSTNLIAQNFFDITDNNLKKNLKKNKDFKINDLIKKIKKLNVLVIGETIFDKYTHVELKGISPKSNILSYIKKNEMIMPGGALASYFFIKSFIKKTNFYIGITNIAK